MTPEALRERAKGVADACRHHTAVDLPGACQVCIGRAFTALVAEATAPYQQVLHDLVEGLDCIPACDREAHAERKKLPSGDALAGRHVHRGVLVPKQVCCQTGEPK